MLALALLLISGAGAVEISRLPQHLPAPLAAAAIGGVIAAMPPQLVLSDPRLAALALRLPGLPAAATIPEAAAAAPRSAAQAQQALAAIHAGLGSLDAAQIREMPANQLAAAVSAIWENVAKTASANAVSHENASDYEKRYRTLEYYLLRKGHQKALLALDFAKRHHKGKRKDGTTPELQHQLEIALYLSTLKDLRREEDTLAAALLHDVMEDYDIERSEMEALFGKDLADTVWRLTKTHKGVKKDLDTYFADIAGDPVASLVKGADRIQNVQSMVGVFDRAKQDEYIEEVEHWFLPMLKQAKYAFPDQSDAYRNIRFLLKSQLDLIRKTRADK